MPEDDKCPVDSKTRSSWSLLLWASQPKEDVNTTINTKPTPQDPDNQPKCPVDHNTRNDWLSKVSVSAQVSNEAVEVSNDKSCTSDQIDQDGRKQGSNSTVNLPTERMISSIPRTSSNDHWIYPSEKQFYEAMTRKNWNPHATDMKTVVPIHNMVNERTWNHILNWERSYYQESLKKCGGIKLTSFQGNPNKLTPRAWFRAYVLGMERPFDRHDWLVDRCGTQVEYVIDYYNQDNGNVFLDVRPKINNWEGAKLRVGRAFGWT